MNTHQSREERGKHRHGFWYYAVPAAILVVFIVSGVLFLRELVTYRKAEGEYDNIRQLITVREVQSGNADMTAAQAGTQNISGTVDETSSGVDGDPAATAKTDSAGYFPDLDVDYDQLEAINDDFVGVIYIPTLELVYPVAHSHNNEEYLHQTFEGSSNPSGCIFMDANASSDFSDPNTFIFGHNMKNMTMFGSLKRFLSDESLCAEDPYFYIYSPEGIRRYKIFAYFTVPRTDSLYDNFTDEKGYDQYVTKAQSYSVYHNADNPVDFDSHPDLVTLSTCWSNTHTHNFVVIGALDGQA